MFTLITGASSGIGFELAHEYAKNGHDLIITARSTEKLVHLKSELQRLYKVQVEVFSCDLAVKNSAVKLHNKIKEHGLNLNGLVNNAGFGDLSEFEKASLDKTLEMIQLNITSLTELTHLFLKELIHHAPSRIMNVASIASFLPGPLMAVYYATKAYVLSFSDAIYTELKSQNVSVTALCPGPTISGFQTAANYSNSSLIEKIKFPTSAQVAEYGYKKTMQGKNIAIHGTFNNFMIFMTRFLPRSSISKMVYALQKK